MSRAAVALFFSALAVAAPVAALASRAGESLEVVWHPARLALGGVGWVHVRDVAEGAAVEGSVAGKPLRFFPYAGGHAALVGIDLETRPGAHAWRVAVAEQGGPPRTAAGRLAIESRRFPVQRLTLPRAMVDLDPAAERRAAVEREALITLYRTITPERLWRGRFTRPVAATEPPAGFGARRILNGQPRAPHSAVDYTAPSGTPVVAANGGRVALVAEFFFLGRLVVLDHGLGLYTLYSHLESASVGVGDRVDRGQTIGAVGATGRATGPHLHWGVQLGGARLDPLALLALPISD